MKKILVCLLCVSILISAFGCKNNERNEVEVKPLEECEVHILLPGSDYPADFNYVVGAINDKLQADGKPYTVKFSFYDNQTYADNLPLLTRDGYDAAYIHKDYLSSYLVTEILVDAKPYLDVYGQDIVENTPDYSFKQVSVGEKIYAIPRSMPLADYHDMAAVRYDWMQEAGIEKITTLDELDDYFQFADTKLKGNTARVYSCDDNYSLLFREFCPTFYFPLVNYACRPVYIDLANKENGKYVVKNYYESEAFKKFTKKTREYYVQQYVTAENISGSINYFYADQLGMVWNTLFKQTERIDEFLATVPNGKLYDVYLNEEDPRYIKEGADNCMVLLKNCKNPNETVDFLNWIRESQENHDLACYGVEGRNYNLTEDGKLDFSQIDLKTRNFSATMPYWAYNDIRFLRFSKNVSDEYIEERKHWDDEAVVSELIGFMPDMKNTEFTAVYANVKAAEASVTDMVNGRVDPSGQLQGTNKTRYQALLDDLKVAGIDRLIEMLQQQLDAFLGQ